MSNSPASDVDLTSCVPTFEPQSLDFQAPIAQRGRAKGDKTAAKKRRGHKRQKKAYLRSREQDEMLDIEASLNTAIGKMSSNLLADYLARSTKRFAEDLSLVEMEDSRIPGMNRS